MSGPPNSNRTVCDIVGDVTPNTSTVSKKNWILQWWRAVLAELVATAVLILIGCMTCIPIDGLPYQPPMYSAIGFGLVVSFNIQIFGHISGAHMNPSVSLAAMLWGSLSIPLGISYVLAQCAGAVLGYGMLMMMSPVDMVSEKVCVTQPHVRLGLYQALIIEIAVTSVLNFINCAVWDPVNKEKTESIPIKFGLAIAGLSLAGGPLTGCSMNPARSLGPALWTGGWAAHWIYWVGPIIGGILPTLIYKYVWLKEIKGLKNLNKESV